MDVPSLELDALLEREWLNANGIGGYACSTAAALNTRKYHGLLVAAMAPPVRRMVLLSHLDEVVQCDGWPVPLSCNEYPGTIHPQGHQSLRQFTAQPHPKWTYQGEGWTLEKTLRLVREENTVCITYALLPGGKAVDLEVRPLMALRPIHELMYQWNAKLDAETIKPGPRAGRSWQQHRVPPTARTPEVFFAHDGSFDASAACWYLNTIYRREEERGYAGLEDLWNPGVVRRTLRPGEKLTFICSSEPIDAARIAGACEAIPRPERSVAGGLADETIPLLARSAEPFVLSLRKAGAAGTLQQAAILSQYPWSAPSGRDAMIGFTGLLLVTERFDAARSLLASLAGQVRDGLLPSEYPEDGSAPRYDAADVSLWFIHNVYQYLRYTGDAKTVRRSLLEAVLEIIQAFQHGNAEAGIRVDAEGLLVTGVPGRQTSWMADTSSASGALPSRTGRQVEVNALWYNALRIAAALSEQFGHARRERAFALAAERTRRGFSEVFWNESSQCCYDVVRDDGADAALRPNQLLACSLPFAVLPAERQSALVQAVLSSLHVPTGVRTLAPSDPAYRGRYAGDASSRDRAHYQGSAFAWLLGPLVTAIVRSHDDSAAARRRGGEILAPCLELIKSSSMLPELFDGDPPHRAGGAIACGTAVAEIFRAYCEDVLAVAPAPRPRPLPASTPLHHDEDAKARSRLAHG